MDYIELSDELYLDAELIMNIIEKRRLRIKALPKDIQEKEEEIIKCYDRIRTQLIQSSVRIRQIGDFAWNE